MWRGVWIVMVGAVWLTACASLSWQYPNLSQWYVFFFQIKRRFPSMKSALQSCFGEIYSASLDLCGERGHTKTSPRVMKREVGDASGRKESEEKPETAGIGCFIQRFRFEILLPWAKVHNDAFPCRSTRLPTDHVIYNSRSFHMQLVSLARCRGW